MFIWGGELAWLVEIPVAQLLDLSKCDSPPLIYTQRKVLREYKARSEPARLKGVLHGTIRNDDF